MGGCFSSNENETDLAALSASDAEAKAELYKKLWKAYDKDGNGHLDENEIKSLLVLQTLYA